jgi:signal transduction histidine kinase
MQENSVDSNAPSGIAALPSLAWGSHIGQLYGSAADLRDLVVPYFKAGLENNERCLWVTDAPLGADDARAALRAVVPDLDARERRGQIEIQDTRAFYDRGQPLQPQALIAGLVQREREALAAGYRGLRTNGNCAWVDKANWKGFLDYESSVEQAVHGRRLICMCSYRHDLIEHGQVSDLLERHLLVLRGPHAGGADQGSPDGGAASKPAGTTTADAPYDSREDIDAVQAISAVPTILDVVCRMTGLGFAVIARVTPERWVCLAARDEIGFGLMPGGELAVTSTLCHEVRQARGAVVIDHVAEDAAYCDHPTPAMYGFQSYISTPIFLHDGSFYGTLCAIDPKPAKLNNPAVIGMFQMFGDLIAFHLEAGMRLAKAEAQLSDALALNALHDQSIAVLGHDLRNPIAAICAGATLLRRSVLDEKARAISEAIGRSADHMAALIDDLSDMTRGRLGNGIPLHLTREGLEAALRHAVDELRLAHPGRLIELTMSIPQPVKADSVYMARLLSNLLKNALSYGSKTDPVKVAVSADTEFVLSVSNKGPQIPRESQKRLFAPFTRGAVGADRHGLGLGLYIVAEIARAHGGTVEIASTKDETQFSFRMPIG